MRPADRLAGLYGGFGIRVGYPSNKLLRSLTAHVAARVRGRVVLALTANGYYALEGIKPGSPIAAAARTLKLSQAFQIGANQWYTVAGGQATGVLKVRSGIIYEVGLADKRLMTSRAAQRRLLGSFGAS